MGSLHDSFSLVSVWMCFGAQVLVFWVWDSGITNDLSRHTEFNHLSAFLSPICQNNSRLPHLFWFIHVLSPHQSVIFSVYCGKLFIINSRDACDALSLFLFFEHFSFGCTIHCNRSRWRRWRRIWWFRWICRGWWWWTYLQKSKKFTIIRLSTWWRTSYFIGPKMLEKMLIAWRLQK